LPSARKWMPSPFLQRHTVIRCISG